MRGQIKLGKWRPFTGVFAVDARVRVAPCQPQDPFLRRLR
jgi:hypothetical protein